MKEHKQEEIDLFLKKAIKDLELNEVPQDFTSSLLSKIERSNKKITVTVYSPLISKSAWWSIGICIIAICTFLGFNTNLINNGWFSAFKWNTVGNTDFLNVLPNLALSDGTVYGLLGLTIFVFVQIIYLKKFFTKRRVII